MNRTSLGLLAIALVVIGGITLTRGPADANSAGFAGGCIRVGIVLGALWLALPQILKFLSKTPKWLLVAGLIGVIVCAVKPLLLVAVIPLLGLLWFLGPRLRAKADTPIVEEQPRQERRPRRRSQSR
jgi:hypothetical protein